MEFDYIIVQAGGKGTRMEHLTKNKPKCLVPVDNLPMMFHLFRKYPDKKFIIIGDYKFDVLKEYLRVFAKVKYILIDAAGKKGTCAGIKDAVNKIPNSKPFMLIWSDLILHKDFELPEQSDNYVGLSGDFKCRWRYENDVFEEIPSVENGVAGLFVFKDKEILSDVLEEGEFVKWLKLKEIKPKTFKLSGTKEYGIISEYNKLETVRCRPFNSMKIEDGRIIKEAIDEQGKQLALREKSWYRHVQQSGVKEIPEIYSYEPFCMEKINGKNIFEYSFSYEEKSEVLERIINMLRSLHNSSETEADYFSINEAYVNKTFSRIESVRKLIPFADEKYITVNGRKCRNIFFDYSIIEDLIKEISISKFSLIHGDCTFSNLMLNKDRQPVMIDPRGYFGYTNIYGDSNYDWAKLYYSIKGNYDQFNIKKFKLDINENEVLLEIASNGWEDMEDKFFELLKDEVDIKQIKLLHAIIWLSLTTYAWEDYDSICGAFYNGLYYLEEILK